MRGMMLWVMMGLVGVAWGESVRWGGAAGPNMVSAAQGLPDDLGKAKVHWEYKIGTHQYSIPTIDRGRIYVAGNDAAVTREGYKRSYGGAVTCLDQKMGRMIWQLPIPRYMGGIIPPYHFDQWRCGVCSGPVADGERIYVIGNRGEVLCLDREGQANGNDGPFVDELKYMDIQTSAGARLEPSDGDIIWKYALIPELDVILHDVCGSTILMLGDHLYVCTSNGIDDKHDKIPRPLAPTLIVLDKKTGRLVAKDEAGIGGRMLHCNWSSPVAGVAGGKTLVYFGAGDGFVYAFEPAQAGVEGVQTLKQVWACDANPENYRRDSAGNEIPHATHRDKRTDGPSEIIGTVVVEGGMVYATIGQSNIHGPGQGCLSCIDAATGKVVWRSTLVDRSLATPAVADGLVYVPDYSGRLHCFDAATGERCWVHELEGKTWFASALAADGKVYIGTENNLLWVLKAGREKQVISKNQLRSPAVTVVAGEADQDGGKREGVLYVPTQVSLMAVAQR